MYKPRTPKREKTAMKHVKFPPRLESKAIGDEWNEKIQGNVLLQGTRLKKSPFFESTLRAGCDGYSVSVGAVHSH